MRTQQEYLEKLKSMRPNIYLDGELIGRDDPRVIKASAAIRLTFNLAQNPDYEDLMVTTSHVTGEKINRFTHIHQSPDDLMKKQEMTRKLCGMSGGCIQRCMGIDMMNAISSVAKDVDDKHGTRYYDNFLKYLEYFQSQDLVCAGSQTDTKGDRAARPSEQWDPDQYLHVVERREDGVVVRGCKVHNTMAPYADELIVVPTRVMGEKEKDYAIAFAIPADAEGNRTTYGNKNMEVASTETQTGATTGAGAVTEIGARIDNIIQDTTKVDKNTANAMFIDYIEPEFTYTYSSTDIDHDAKTLTVDFSVTDKYFNSSTISSNASVKIILKSSMVFSVFPRSSFAITISAWELFGIAFLAFPPEKDAI